MCLTRLENEYREAGQSRAVRSVEGIAAGRAGTAPLQADIAAELRMTENAVKQAFHRFRQRYQATYCVKRSRIPSRCHSDVEDELRHFVSVLRA